MKEFDFWEAAEKNKKVTDQWPLWKKNIRLTKYSTGILTSEEKQIIKRMIYNEYRDMWE